MAEHQNTSRTISGADTAKCGPDATDCTLRTFLSLDLLEKALDHAPQGASLDRIAADVFKREKGHLGPLMERLALQCILLELRRIRIDRARKMQMYLPGFEAMPQRLPRSDGKGKRKLFNATYRDVLWYYRGVLQKTKTAPKVTQAKALVDLMRKHQTHGMTVGEALEKEGITPKLPD